MSELNRARRSSQEQVTELRKQVGDLRDAAVSRKRVEDALRETAEQRGWLLNHAPVGLCWLSDEGEVVVVNDTLSLRLGYRSIGELTDLSRTFGLFRSNPDDPDPAEVRFVPARGTTRAGLRRRDGEIIPAELLAVHTADVWYRGVVVAVW